MVYDGLALGYARRMRGQRVPFIVSIFAALLVAACAPVPPRETPAPAEPGAPTPAPPPGSTPVVEADTTLAALTVSRGALAPAFDPAHPDYTVDVAWLVGRVRIAARAADPDASISIADGPPARGEATAEIALAPGAHPVGIDVTAGGGDARRTYTVTIGRSGPEGLSQRAYIKASNADSNDLFGYAVALSGDTLAIGAYLEDSYARGVDRDQGDNSADGSGAVYIFERTDSGWSQTAYIKGSNTRSGDQFGRAIALSGDTLAVGAPFESEPGEDGTPADARDSGAAYVFRRTAGTWREEARLKAANAGAGDLFGAALAIEGDTLAVGAYLEDGAAAGDGTDDAAPNSGAVYVFARGDDGWTQTARLKASGARQDERFGYSVALSGNRLAAGAYLESGDTAGVDGAPLGRDVPNSGAVHVFARGPGGWMQESTIKADEPGANDLFGSAVALAGATLAVGAHLEDRGAENAGAVYVYRREAAGWRREAVLRAADAAADDRFGRSVALGDDTLAIGAYLRDGADATDSGAVYLFRREPGGRWLQEGRIEANDAGPGAMFGYALGLSRDTLVVGAPMEAGAATGIDAEPGAREAPGAGAVYVFR